ncbi:MAG: hypothetical protein CR982_00610 [Candidatus Cloacimonadota bacterium]|nr:MAG: hypothetical protein CR982_00610 [Candidatus Cloacimonadota bacterium]PIE78432.1 MAG: hypothetical protein CSA15_07785 [Candidatus Delongbacteria bacterium]
MKFKSSFLKALLFLLVTLLFSCEKTPFEVNSGKENTTTKTETNISMVGEAHNYLVEKTYQVLQKEYPEGLKNNKKWNMSRVVNLVVKATNIAIKEDPSLGGLLTFDLDTLNCDFNYFTDEEFISNLENLNPTEKYLNCVSLLLTVDNISYTETFDFFNTIESKASSLPEEEKNSILAGISTGKSSLNYWNKSSAKWFKMINPNADFDRSNASNIGKEDVKGAVAGAIGGSGILPGAGSAGGAVVVGSAMSSIECIFIALEMIGWL